MHLAAQYDADGCQTSGSFRFHNFVIFVEIWKTKMFNSKGEATRKNNTWQRCEWQWRDEIKNIVMQWIIRMEWNKDHDRNVIKHNYASPGRGGDREIFALRDARIFFSFIPQLKSAWNVSKEREVNSTTGGFLIRLNLFWKDYFFLFN